MLPHAVKGFFENGGGICYVVRIPRGGGDVLSRSLPAVGRAGVEPLRDPRVRENEAYATVIVLVKVITELGTVGRVTTKTVENLFVDDYRYLQDFYRVINFGDPADPTGAATMAAVGRLEGIAGSDRHEAGPVSPAAPEHGAAAAPGPRRLQDIDIERIVEAVEQRLLRQLERRGGRYAGVF